MVGYNAGWWLVRSACVICMPTEWLGCDCV